MIEGGFYLKARCIQEAEIMHAPPHVREIWDWLLMKAMFSDGKNIKRGQVFTTYSEIQQALSWNIGWRIMKYSRDDCEKAMKWLRKAEMVTTQKTTRGLIITICKYDYYQNPSNYESHTESYRKTTGEPHNLHTINKNDKNKKNIYISTNVDIMSKNGHCPHQQIIDLYHNKLPMLPRLRVLTNTRKKHLASRWKEDAERQSLEWWDGFFEYISKSKFLTGKITGKNGNAFFASLDWIIKPENFAKIIEGKYE